MIRRAGRLVWRKLAGRPIDEIVSESLSDEVPNSRGPYGPRPPYIPRHAKYVPLKVKKESNGS